MHSSILFGFTFTTMNIALFVVEMQLGLAVLLLVCYFDYQEQGQLSFLHLPFRQVELPLFQVQILLFK